MQYAADAGYEWPGNPEAVCVIEYRRQREKKAKEIRFIKQAGDSFSIPGSGAHIFMNFLLFMPIC